MAETAAGEVLGFQFLGTQGRSTAPPGWGISPPSPAASPATPGRVGVALFEATNCAARDLGLIAINATNRADNDAGIPYYEKLGFETCSVAEGLPLNDGTPVDRVSKVYRLA